MLFLIFWDFELEYPNGYECFGLITWQQKNNQALISLKPHSKKKKCFIYDRLQKDVHGSVKQANNEKCISA